MAILRNTGAIPRIITTEAGDYIRLAPGCITANIEVDLDRRDILAWMAAGDLVEVKPKPSKPKASNPKAVKPSA